MGRCCSVRARAMHSSGQHQCRLCLHWGPGHPPDEPRKYLPGFPYSWSLRRLRQKISSIYCTVVCNYPSAAQEQPFTVGQFRITKTVNRYQFKKIISPQTVGGPSKRKNPGALGTCPVCPLVKTALDSIRDSAVVPDYGLRQLHRWIQLPTGQKAGAQRSVASYTGPAVWNSLPATLWNSSVSLCIRWNDVTESMVARRSPFCGYNTV